MKRKTAERAEILGTLGEVFRQHGYEGASLTLITRATGLGKGSLYHLFPGGKAEMAEAVLAEIDGWFRTHMFEPLRQDDEPRRAIAQMFETTDFYFRSGRRMCLVGVMALGDARDPFAERIAGYFAEWRDALASALRRAGHDAAETAAEEVVAGIQGALVATRALGDPALFGRLLGRLAEGLGLVPA